MIVTYGEFGVEDVLAWANQARNCNRYFTIDAGIRTFIIKNSQQYRLFNITRTCVDCGIEGTRFFLQARIVPYNQTFGIQWYDDQKRISYPKPIYRAYFALYGERYGHLVMLTKDHIRPQCRHGLNQMSNYQVMCQNCNRKKGTKIIDLRGEEYEPIKTSYCRIAVDGGRTTLQT